MAGTAYLRLMYDRFGYPGLFAAYNARPVRYARHLATGERLPAETVAYMAAVTGDAAPVALGRDVPRIRHAGEAPPLRSVFALAPRFQQPVAGPVERGSRPVAAGLFVPLAGDAAR